MTHLSIELANRIRGSIKRWFYSRMHESMHCCQCGGAVTPWDSYCPTCGQGNPVRFSASAAIYLVLAFGLLAMIISSVILAF